MCKSIPGTQKHMTMDQRIMIEKGLDQSSSLRSIALQLPNIFLFSKNLTFSSISRSIIFLFLILHTIEKINHANNVTK